MERYSGVKSAERMFDIVELLNRCRGASVTELATKSGFSRRAVDRMLASLIKYGYVRRLETDGKYYLSHLIQKTKRWFYRGRVGYRCGVANFAGTCVEK